MRVAHPGIIGVLDARDPTRGRVLEREQAAVERLLLDDATRAIEGEFARLGARVLDGEGGMAIDSASADLLDVCEGDMVWSVAR